MQKKGLTVGLSTFAICFYIAIIMYVFFAILHIDTLVNFETGLAFEIIGFVLLTYFIIGNIVSKPIKTGFFVPLLMITIIYTVLLDIINIAFITSIPHVFFVLVHFVILFIYCVVSIPIYIMGRR